MSIIKIDDFNKDGKVDWTAYHKARERNGDICTECGAHILWGKGIPSKCNECNSISTDNGEVDHESRVRCPKCRYIWNPYDFEQYKLYEDGTHDASCPECSHDFEVTTYVSYTFSSPEVLSKEIEDEEGDSLAEE